MYAVPPPCKNVESSSRMTKSSSNPSIQRQFTERVVQSSYNNSVHPTLLGVRRFDTAQVKGTHLKPIFNFLANRKLKHSAHFREPWARWRPISRRAITEIFRVVVHCNREPNSQLRKITAKGQPVFNLTRHPLCHIC